MKKQGSGYNQPRSYNPGTAKNYQQPYNYNQAVPDSSTSFIFIQKRPDGPFCGGGGGAGRVSSIGVSQFSSSVAATHPPPNSAAQVQQPPQNQQHRNQAPSLSSAHNPLNQSVGPPNPVPHSQHHTHTVLAQHHQVLSSGVGGAAGGLANQVQQQAIATGVPPGASPGPPHELNAQGIPQSSTQQIQQGSGVVALPGGVAGTHSMMYPSANQGQQQQGPQPNPQGQYFHPGPQNTTHMHVGQPQPRQVISHPQQTMHVNNYQYANLLSPMLQHHGNNIYSQFAVANQSRAGAANAQPQFAQMGQAPQHSPYPMYQMQAPIYYQAPPHIAKAPVSTAPPQREKNVIPIIDPITNKNILEDIPTANSKPSQSPSPLHSRDSSTATTPAPRETPTSKSQSSDIRAQFALQVVNAMSANDPNIGNDQSDAVDCAISTNKSSESSHSDLNSEIREKDRLLSSVDNKLKAVDSEIDTRCVPELNNVSKSQQQQAHLSTSLPTQNTMLSQSQPHHSISHLQPHTSHSPQLQSHNPQLHTHSFQSHNHSTHPHNHPTQAHLTPQMQPHPSQPQSFNTLSFNTQQQSFNTQSQSFNLPTLPYNSQSLLYNQQLQPSNLTLQPNTLSVQPNYPQQQSHNFPSSQSHNFHSQSHNFQSQSHNSQSQPHISQSQPHISQSQPHISQSQSHNTQTQPHNLLTQTHNLQTQPQNSQIQPQNSQIQPQNSQPQPNNSQPQPHNSQTQPHNSQPHNSQTQSHSSQTQSHNSQSHNSQTQSHNSQAQPHNSQTQSHNSQTQSHNSQTQSHNSQTQSHNSQTQPLNSQTPPHNPQTQSNSVQSQPQPQRQIKQQRGAQQPASSTHNQGAPQQNKVATQQQPLMKAGPPQTKNQAHQKSGGNQIPSKLNTSAQVAQPPKGTSSGAQPASQATQKVAASTAQQPQSNRQIIPQSQQQSPKVTADVPQKSKHPQPQQQQNPVPHQAPTHMQRQSSPPVPVSDSSSAQIKTQPLVKALSQPVQVLPQPPKISSQPTLIPTQTPQVTPQPAQLQLLHAKVQSELVQVPPEVSEVPVELIQEARHTEPDVLIQNTVPATKASVIKQLEQVPIQQLQVLPLQNQAPPQDLVTHVQQPSQSEVPATLQKSAMPSNEQGLTESPLPQFSVSQGTSRKLSGDQIPLQAGFSVKPPSPSLDPILQIDNTGAPANKQGGSKSSSASPIPLAVKKETTLELPQLSGKRGKEKGTEECLLPKEPKEPAVMPVEETLSRVSLLVDSQEVLQLKVQQPNRTLKTPPQPVPENSVEAPQPPPPASQTPKSGSPIPSQVSLQSVTPGIDSPVVDESKEELEETVELESKDEHVNNVDDSKVSNHEEENCVGDKPKSSSSLFKYTYKEGQWSPDNPEGKLQYDRNFLLEMQKNPLSLKRPDSLPSLEVVLDGPHNRSHEFKTPKMLTDFTPSFLQNTSRSRGPPPFMQQKVVSRNSQQGRRTQRIIDIKLSSSSEVKLKTSENAWKPSTKKTEGDKDESEAKHEELLKRMRGILNKLTPENFAKLVTKVQALPIETIHNLDGVIGLIFEKAVDEQAFSTTYAQLCQVLSQMSVKENKEKEKSVKESKDKGELRFRNLIINRCQKEFEKDNAKDLKRIEKEREIESCIDLEKKVEMKATLDYEETKLRKRSVGNIRFIGELYKLKMLTSPIMMRIIAGLLEKKDEESLECLCKLLTTIGKNLETNAKNAAKAQDDLNNRFATMKHLVDSKQTSSRVRFLLMDVIDLRKNNWIPRREDTKPKTKAQVHEEIRKEEIEQQIALSTAPKRDDRDRKRSRDNRGMGSSEEGWNTVSTNTRRGPFDSSRLKSTTFNRHGGTEGNVELRAGFSNWARGSSGGVKEQEEESRPNNRFSVLDTQIPGGDIRRTGAMGTRLAPGGGSAFPHRHSNFGSKSMPPPSEKESAITTVKSFVSPDERSKSNSRSNSRDSSLVRETAVNNRVSSVVLDFDTAEKYAKPIIEEYVSNLDSKEAKTCIQEKFNAASVALFIQVSLEWIIDRDSEKRKHVGHLYRELIMDKIMTISQFMDGTKPVVEMMEDYEIDIPQVCSYLGEILACLLVDGALKLEELLKVVVPSESKKCTIFAKIIYAAVKLMGLARVAEIWKNSGLNWESILPASTDVSEFLQKHDIIFTLDCATENAPVIEAVEPEFDAKKTRTELIKLFKRNASDEEIFGWVDANVGSHCNSKKFVRALTAALIESFFTTSLDGSSVVVGDDFEAKLREKVQIVHRYVENSEKLELPCIFGMQSLCVEYQHPPGLLEQCFNVFYDKDILSEDSFMEWENNEDPEEQVGKGVCVTSVRKFLKWLTEADADDQQDYQNSHQK